MWSDDDDEEDRGTRRERERERVQGMLREGRVYEVWCELHHRHANSIRRLARTHAGSSREEEACTAVWNAVYRELPDAARSRVDVTARAWLLAIAREAVPELHDVDDVDDVDDQVEGYEPGRAASQASRRSRARAPATSKARTKRAKRSPR